MKRRPNILFLMSDEHRADITGYEGNSVIRTPMLDELASTGVVFSNAYTPAPICIPGRQAMMAGQLPKTCNVRDFGEDLEPGYLTFSKRFSQYAYSTVVSGKLHHVGSDQLQGWTTRVAGDISMNPTYIEDRVEEEFAYYKKPSPKWSDAKEIKRAGVATGSHVGRDKFVVDGAINFITEYFNSPYYDRESTEKPLMLKVSLLQPHYPYFTSEEKFNYYLNRVTPYVGEEVFDHPFLSERQVDPEVDVTKRELRRATAAYYGMIEEIDEQYQRVIEALEHVGQDLDNWIIIYTTDHGEMLGEHGIWEKQKFFEASVRVPLIIRWPNGFGGGRVVEENVSLCDLYATLCELAGLPIPEGLDSRSLVPLINEDTEEWSNEVISQFTRTNLMIKWDDLKYQYYGSDRPEVLFDLKVDPQETKNFIDDPAYTQIVSKFRKRCAELGYGPDADPNYVNAGY